MNAIDLGPVHAEFLDPTTQGDPLSAAPLPLSAIGAQGWRWRADEADAPQMSDLIGCGISLPCTTFDQGRVLFTVDGGDRVTGAIRTFF